MASLQSRMEAAVIAETPRLPVSPRLYSAPRRGNNTVLVLHCTCTAGYVGCSSWAVSIASGAVVTRELAFLLLVGPRRAGDTLLHLTMVIRSLRAAN